MFNKYMVMQNGYRDCGPSCLLSIMKYYGLEASHEEVSYILKTDMSGVNAYNIIEGAKSFGFDGYGIHYSYEDIINNNISFPIICHVLKDSMYHFIVIYGIKNKKLIVMDPSTNNRYISFMTFKEIYLNTSIVIYPSKIINNIYKRKSLYEFIINYISLDKVNCIKVSVISIIAIILGLLSNMYTMIIIDRVLPNFKFKSLIIVSLIFFNILIIKSIISYIRGKLLIKINNNISSRMNNDVIRHLFYLPYQFFKNRSTGEVISRIEDLKSFNEILSQIIVSGVMDILLIIVSMIILLIINVKLFLISFVSMVLYFIIVLCYRRVFLNKTESLLIKEGKYNKYLNESIYGYESNMNLNMINDVLMVNSINYKSYINSFSLYESKLNDQIFIKDIILNISYIISIVFGSVMINKGIITLGEFLLFNSTLYYFTEPIKSTLDLEPNLNMIRNVYNRLNDILLAKMKSVNSTSKMINGNILINNLSYSYNGIDNVINNVSFEIKACSKYLIYGSSGNGKSTVIKILLKYLNNYKGEIYINNINIKDIDESIILNSITYVSQNNFIASDTFENCIKYNRNISESDYEKVISMVNLEHLRNSKPLRNKFYIEEDGFNISGGERQKIILARSLLKECNYLILDEALSEVGIFEEKEIINKMFDYFYDKTIIYISHKKEIIDLFNEKYKLERSEVC